MVREYRRGFTRKALAGEHFEKADSKKSGFYGSNSRDDTRGGPMRLGVVMGGDSADAPFIRVHAAFALNASPDGEAELVTSVVADVVAGHQRIRRQSNYSFWILDPKAGSQVLLSTHSRVSESSIYYILIILPYRSVSEEELKSVAERVSS